MRVLVIGGTRFIGRYAVRSLVSAGCEVAVFHRGKTPADELPSNVTTFLGDRNNLKARVETFRRFAPNVVLDMFALTEAHGCGLVETFRGIAERLVVISSLDVYRAYDCFRRVSACAKPEPVLTERSPLRDVLFPYRTPDTKPDDFVYDYDKILVERAAQSRPDDLPTTILRLPMVYGPGDYQHRTFPYLKRMDDGRDYLLMSREQFWWEGARGYVEDMAHAILICVTDPGATGKIYHVGDKGGGNSETRWIERIGRAAGWAGDVVTMDQEKLPAHLRDDYDYSQHWRLYTDEIRLTLGYAEVIAPDEAMRRTVEWQRANPPKNVDVLQFDYKAEDAVLRSLPSEYFYTDESKFYEDETESIFWPQRVQYEAWRQKQDGRQ